MTQQETNGNPPTTQAREEGREEKKMKSSRLERLYEQYREAQQKRAEQDQKIREAMNSARARRVEAEEAAEAGDLDAYEVMDAAAKKEEARLYVLQKSRKAPELNMAEAKDAWAEFAQTWAKEMAKRWSIYKAARKELCQQYQALAVFQNDLLTARQNLADLVGIDPGELPIEGFLPNTREDAPRNTGTLNAPEFAFFADSGLFAPDPKADTWNRWPALNVISQIVANHKPVAMADLKFNP